MAPNELFRSFPYDRSVLYRRHRGCRVIPVVAPTPPLLASLAQFVCVGLMAAGILLFLAVVALGWLYDREDRYAGISYAAHVKVPTSPVPRDYRAVILAWCSQCSRKLMHYWCRKCGCYHCLKHGCTL